MVLVPQDLSRTFFRNILYTNYNPEFPGGTNLSLLATGLEYFWSPLNLATKFLDNA